MGIMSLISKAARVVGVATALLSFAASTLSADASGIEPNEAVVDKGRTRPAGVYTQGYGDSAAAAATVERFHAAVGPTDHKCLDLLRERGAITGNGVAAVTGLTTGAITGVAARLERAGYLRR